MDIVNGPGGATCFLDSARVAMLKCVQEKRWMEMPMATEQTMMIIETKISGPYLSSKRASSSGSVMRLMRQKYCHMA